MQPLITSTITGWPVILVERSTPTPAISRNQVSPMNLTVKSFISSFSLSVSFCTGFLWQQIPVTLWHVAVWHLRHQGVLRLHDRRVIHSICTTFVTELAGTVLSFLPFWFTLSTGAASVLILTEAVLTELSTLSARTMTSVCKSVISPTSISAWAWIGESCPARLDTETSGLSPPLPPSASLPRGQSCSTWPSLILQVKHPVSRTPPSGPHLLTGLRPFQA